MRKEDRKGRKRTGFSKYPKTLIAETVRRFHWSVEREVLGRVERNSTEFVQIIMKSIILSLIIR